MQKVVLSMDTSKHDKLIVGLTIDDKEVILEEKFDFKKSQGILPMIERILKQNSINVSELTEITINPGPGSFTGLRVGVAIANTLGLVLQIPVNNNDSGIPVEPVYE